MLVGASLTPARADGQLCQIEQSVRAKHQQIEHTEPSAIAGRLATPSVEADRQVILVDVREADEFGVSHLPGALRIDPAATPEDLLRHIGDVAGREVVLYCSVGVRSSKLGARALTALKAAGATRVANLSGGIFRWHNEGRPLAVGTAPSRDVHPYNFWWGRLVRDQSRIRYSPVPRR
ncbi:MAG: rhodanese-like domain-containing protein [Pseudomonadota bacterium]